MESIVPYDYQLEEEVIGSMLYDPACIADLVEILKPGHFYYSKHQRLCEEIYRLWQEDEKLVNIMELVPFLEKNNISVQEIHKATSQIVTTAAVKHHAGRLKDLASLRNIVNLGREMATWGHLRDREEIREAINKAETRIAGITDGAMSMNTLKSLPEVLNKYRVNFMERYKKGEAITGIPSGFQDLDYLTTGFKKQDLIIIAARPSMGKTAFALDIALKMSEIGKSVFFAELEMSEDSVANRMVANIANVDSIQLASGLVSEEEYKRTLEAMDFMDTKHKTLSLDTLPGVSVAEIKAKARKIKREKGLDCVIVDYLGLIASPGLTNRYDIISENTRMLKNMARELDCPVIVLCQLSRAVEQRQDKRPMLSDLRESGEIEQTADVVMFLYRDDYYNPDSEKKNITELIIGKQRNGPLGKIELLFMKQYSKFLPLTKRDR